MSTRSGRLRQNRRRGVPASPTGGERRHGHAETVRVTGSDAARRGRHCSSSALSASLPATRRPVAASRHLDGSASPGDDQVTAGHLVGG